MTQQQPAVVQKKVEVVSVHRKQQSCRDRHTAQPRLWSALLTATLLPAFSVSCTAAGQRRGDHSHHQAARSDTNKHPCDYHADQATAQCRPFYLSRRPLTHRLPLLQPCLCTGEDHTFGNTIRYILATQPTTDFVGYSIPHPSEHVIHIRLQTTPNTTVRQSMAAACTVLEEVSDVMLSRFEEAVERAVREGRSGGGSGGHGGEGVEEEEADHQMEEID